MSASILRVLVVVLATFLVGTAAAGTIDTVPVGNPGNAPDTRYETPGSGNVAYTYSIGKYEVTAGQYTTFLNAVAATDTYGLYNTNMWSDGYGCKIERSGTPDSYVYSVASEYANRPVNYVSYWDACRFTNWLHNGQPTGDQGAGTTETGAYTLNGYNGVDGRTINRNADWKWAVTSGDEWYKAAYHKNDGMTGNYWTYPASSDEINTSMANYRGSAGHPTDVGVFPYPSAYGTYDQGGNVWEWTEALFHDSWRRLRGGAFYTSGADLRGSSRFSVDPANEGNGVGFRVAEVPEPSSAVLLLVGTVGILRRRFCR